MTRRATVIQPDGMLRHKNPANRAALRKHFADDRWRTAYDMGVTLHSRGVIPACVAVQVLARSPRARLRPVADQIAVGCRQLVLETVTTAVSRGIFESRGAGSEREFRCVKRRTDHPRVGTELSAEELGRPSDSTAYGISYAAAYQQIVRNPGIDFEALVLALVPSMREDQVLARYSKEKVRQISRKIKHGTEEKKLAAATARVEASRKKNPETFLAEARRHSVRQVVRDLCYKKKKKKAKRADVAITIAADGTRTFHATEE
jgi:hypothetical protein